MKRTLMENMKKFAWSTGSAGWEKAYILELYRQWTI